MKLAEFPNYYRERLVPILGSWLAEGAVQAELSVAGRGLEVGQEMRARLKDEWGGAEMTQTFIASSRSK